MNPAQVSYQFREEFRKQVRQAVALKYRHMEYRLVRTPRGFCFLEGM